MLEIKWPQEPFFLCRENTWNSILRPEKNLTHWLRSPKALFRLSTILTTIVKNFTLWLKLSRYFFMFNVAQGLRLVLTPTKSQMPYLTYKILICRLTQCHSKITVLCLKSNCHMNLSTSVVRILELLFQKEGRVNMFVNVRGTRS